MPNRLSHDKLLITAPSSHLQNITFDFNVNQQKQIPIKKSSNDVLNHQRQDHQRIVLRIRNKVDKWTLISPIANRGNSFVWVCSDNNGNKLVIKVLKKIKEKAYKRFVDETSVLEKISDIDGIVPIIDKYLPASFFASTSYYIMPLAQSAETLCIADLNTKIDAVIALAKTLAELHKRRIYHRDIKLPNILFYRNRYCFADFGLVDYPEKQDVSRLNEEIGPKFNMAPEMRRESSKADPAKADIFSFAKTFWTILTGSSLGFDGVYIPGSSIGIKKRYPDRYLYPIENILTRCTDNDPNSRLTIEQFIEQLVYWKELDADFHKRNLQEWIRFQTELLPTPLPQRTTWHKPQEIADILNRLCTVSNLTHVFFPGHGGLDIVNAKLSLEEGCLELNFGGVEIVKPKRLVFETFGDDFQWNYFRLELDSLEPCRLNDDDVQEAEDRREELAELSPASYYPVDILKNRPNYKSQYFIPYGARIVRRWFGGNFVIFSKRSYYNLASQTYDGRHDRFDSDGFRDYIIKEIAGVKKILQKQGLIPEDPDPPLAPATRNHEIYEQTVYRCGYCGNIVNEDGSELSHVDYQYKAAILDSFGSQVTQNVVGFCCKQEHNKY